MSSHTCARRVWITLGVLLVTIATAMPAQAVIISNSGLLTNTTDPGGNSPWGNMAQLSSSTAVYLGNRWVLTANHVTTGSTVTLTDGRVMTVSHGTGTRVTNAGTGALGNADLKLLRLAQDPGLPALEIGATRPAAGSHLMMIGAGVDRESTEIGWRLTGGPTGPVWTEVPLPLANVTGYKLANTQHMRWGANQMATSQPLFTTGNTIGFLTQFDLPGIPHEAQAAFGDSGGGVFYHSGDAWQLVGIMLASQGTAGQPDNTVVYGNGTYVADLSFYRNQILDVLNRPEPLWQNQLNNYSATGSGHVGPRDALVIINRLMATPGGGPLTGAPGLDDYLVDTDGNGSLNSADALRVINALLNKTANPALAAAPLADPLVMEPLTTIVPEPSTLALTALAAAFLAVAAIRRRVRGR